MALRCAQLCLWLEYVIIRAKTPQKTPLDPHDQVKYLGLRMVGFGACRGILLFPGC